ncbi:MAG: MlaD family protein, partial [Actinomycetota bacterium]|nr:MlaD family protein [Actinomycetota bacterium]
PTMVGAVTTLIVIVAVFLAYNANNGLPFVPAYRVSAEMCNAARLKPNNEVRIGGNRVGVVESIETIQLEEASGCQTAGGDSSTAAAKLNLKLDDSAKPLPVDSTIRVRYRSSFGLKYLEIDRGGGEGLPEGATLPITQAEQQTEFDDIGNTFDTPTREASRTVLEGFGNAFAARGASLNQAIESLNPLFANLEPVSRALSDPTTDLVRFFPELADAARIIAPVAEDNAAQFTNAAIAFAAISSDPQALRDTISNAVPTLEVGIESLPVQQPFLRDFAAFSRLLRPGVRDLRISLPVLNGAVSAGAKTLPRTVQLNTDLEAAMVELEQLVDEPSTLVSLTRLGDLFDEANSAGQFLVPYQTTCNYWNFWFTYLTEHFGGQDQFGSHERLVATGAPNTTTPDEFPRNSLSDYAGSQADGRYSDIYDLPGGAKDPPAGIFDPLPVDDPGNPTPPAPELFQPILHGEPYGPSGTEQAPNCQAGQVGYPLGGYLIPGQGAHNPTFGPSNISQALGTGPLGRTDLFLTQTGERIFWDSP